MSEFLEFKIFVLNLYRSINQVCEERWRISDLVERVSKELQFPPKAKAISTLGGNIYDPNFLVKDIITKQLQMNFYLQDKIIFHNSFLKDRIIIANVLGNAQELEETIKTELPLLPYQIRLIDNRDASKWRQRISGGIKYEIEAQCFIFYQNSHIKFKIDPFKTFQEISEQVKSQFGIRYPIIFKYNGLNLDNQDRYYQHQITNNALLQIQIQDRISLFIQGENATKQILVSPEETVVNLKSYISRLFSLNTEFDLFYSNQILNSSLKLRQTRTQDDDILVIKSVDPPFMQMRLMIKPYSDIDRFEYIASVKSSDKIVVLDTFIKNATYFHMDKELEKDKKFSDYTDYREPQIEYKKYWLVVTFQHKWFSRKRTITVLPDENIESYVNELLNEDQYKPEKQNALVFYDESEIDPKLTFKESKIENKSIIYYCRDTVKIKVSDTNNSIHYYDMKLKTTGHELKQFILEKFQLINFILMYRNDVFPLNEDLLSHYHPDEEFKIEEPKQKTIAVNIHIEQFELNLQENLRLDATAMDLKEQIQAQFNIPSANSIFLKYQNRLVHDSEVIINLDYQNTEFYVEIEEQIQVIFKNLEDNILHASSFLTTAVLRDELAYFCQPDQVSCTHKGQLLDKNLTFMELNILDNDVIIVNQIQTTQVAFKRRGDFKIIQKQCDVQLTLKDAIAQITKRAVVCFIKGSEVDLSKSLISLQLKEVIEYEYTIRVTFMKRGQLFCTKTVMTSNIAQEALYGQISQPVCMFLQSKIIEANKTWEALDIVDDCTISIEEAVKTFVVQDQLQTLKINAKITSTVQQLRSMLQLNDQAKLFYYQDQQLNDDTVMYTLTGQKNEIVIECKEKAEMEYSLHIPISLELPLRIKLIDENGKQFDEEVKASMKIEDFVKFFQQKEGMKILTFFYEGEEMDKSKTFEQQCISNGAEIEIQY